MLKYGSFRFAMKYDMAPQTPKLIFNFFFSPSVRMTRKNINFEDKKNPKK